MNFGGGLNGTLWVFMWKKPNGFSTKQTGNAKNAVVIVCKHVYVTFNK